VSAPRAARRPAAVYAIADLGLLGTGAEAAVAAMAEAGIETIQLRAKRLADDELFRLAERLLGRLEGWPGELWIDDRADFALLLPFAGVHLGQRDLPPAAVRPLLPERTAIGWSTHDESQLAAGAADPAVDWLALGPIFPTASKADPDPVVGLEGLARLAPAARKPLVAIGGIDAERLPRVLEAGADSAAILSALCRGDVAANSRRLLVAAGTAVARPG
jgi:thiamine-phosphate pyrophosphorylase